MQPPFADRLRLDPARDLVLELRRPAGVHPLLVHADHQDVVALLVAERIAGKKGFDLKNKEEAKKDDKDKNPYDDLKAYENRGRESVRSNIPGAIYKVSLDNTHPLAFGFPNFYYTLKLDDKVYQYLSNGWNVGVIKKDNYVAGFVGAQAKKKLVDGLLFGVQEMGNGSIVYLADDPLFRSFWENGKLLFSNAVFMVGH